MATGNSGRAGCGQISQSRVIRQVNRCLFPYATISGVKTVAHEIYLRWNTQAGTQKVRLTAIACGPVRALIAAPGEPICRVHFQPADPRGTKWATRRVSGRRATRPRGQLD